MSEIQATRRRLWRRLTLACGSALSLASLTACDLAPDYHPATFVVPASWQGQGPFHVATPADETLPTNWWIGFGDPMLNSLEDRATAGNADLQASAERFIQARSMVVQARAQLLPHLGLEAGASDNKQSVNRLFRYKGPVTSADAYYQGVASWEPDFWSEIRNQVRAQKQYAQQKAADFAMARLSTQAELATDYIELRGYDAQIAIYKQSIAYYQKALSITQNQLENQAAPRLDVARAQAQLYSTQAAELDIEAARGVTEHAIAILTNASPSSFHIPADQTLVFNNPNVPAGIPSELLQRRPDIASAERAMAQSNRDIGIARAAFYPHINFNLLGGFDSNNLDLSTLSNSLWSYGAGLSMPLFEGGMRRAELQRSWSEYRETRDEYRHTVLAAFREVEDGLTNTNRLTLENDAMQKAVAATLATQNMTMTLYQGGVGTYLEAIFAQVQTLETRIHQVEIATRMYQAKVSLIRALGGGWDVKTLPTMDQTLSIDPLQYDHLHHPNTVGGVTISQHPEQFENLANPAPTAPAASAGSQLTPLPSPSPAAQTH
jgi:outer membrane protein, multidrug efflux system